MSTMADGFTSIDKLPPYVLDGLFDSFSDESLLEVDDRKNNDVSPTKQLNYKNSRLRRVSYLNLHDP